MEFRDHWITDLLDQPDTGEIYEKNQRHSVVVPGLCPFHILAQHTRQGTAICGGLPIHIHEATITRPDDSHTVDKHSMVLNQALVTIPIPMDALIASYYLFTHSLYYYLDAKFKASYADAYQLLDTKGPPVLDLDHRPRIDYAVNPVCHRILQQKAARRRWMLDTAYRFSLDAWENQIGYDNTLLSWRGNRVPFPQDPRFRAQGSPEKCALAFWSSYQREVWDEFLDPKQPLGECCYLDATYDYAADGFQLWTLLVEKDQMSIPVSFLVTTSTTVGLLRSWLAEISNHSPADLPKRTLYVNSPRLMGLAESAFLGWDIKYAKYYVVQELRHLVLRSNLQADKKAQRAIQMMETELSSAIKATLETPEIKSQAMHLFDGTNSWLPSSERELEMFQHSSEVLSRWRYLLWIHMLALPKGQKRLDQAIYYIWELLVPQLSQKTKGKGGVSMDGMELGGGGLDPRIKELRAKKLNDWLVCLSEDRELALKIIVDLEHNVCFCTKFSQTGLCHHLVFCSPAQVHHPMLPKLLSQMPNA